MTRNSLWCNTTTATFPSDSSRMRLPPLLHDHPLGQRSGGKHDVERASSAVDVEGDLRRGSGVSRRLDYSSLSHKVVREKGWAELGVGMFRIGQVEVTVQLLRHFELLLSQADFSLHSLNRCSTRLPCAVLAFPASPTFKTPLHFYPSPFTLSPFFLRCSQAIQHSTAHHSQNFWHLPHQPCANQKLNRAGTQRTLTAPLTPI